MHILVEMQRTLGRIEGQTQHIPKILDRVANNDIAVKVDAIDEHAQDGQVDDDLICAGYAITQLRSGGEQNELDLSFWTCEGDDLSSGVDGSQAGNQDGCRERGGDKVAPVLECAGKAQRRRRFGFRCLRLRRF